MSHNFLNNGFDQIPNTIISFNFLKLSFNFESITKPKNLRVSNVNKFNFKRLKTKNEMIISINANK